MKQTSTLTRNLAARQETAARIGSPLPAGPIRFSLYTEDRPGLSDIIGRYFDGATIHNGIGLWRGSVERSAIVEILGTREDVTRVFYLAGDIRAAGRQSSVIVTWEPIGRSDVDEL